MAPFARRAIYTMLLLGLVVACFILLSGNASATPDSNNDHTQAVEVANSDVVSGSVSTADDLEDYFKIHVEDGDVLDLYLVMDVGTDIDLYLFDSTMTLVDQSSTDNSVSGVYDEQITIDVATSGWHYLSVYAYSGESDYLLYVRSTAEWTVMVYMDGDNNLEGQAIGDFLEMSDVGSTADLNIVVQMDRISGYDASYGDWTGANRYRVEQGMVPDAASALMSIGEVNMGDAGTLTDFVVWGASNFPAHHFLLVLWDHGGNWEGACWDDSSAGDMLDLPELSGAMSSASSALGFDMDMIGFDACQMAGVEVYFELYSFTSYFVGSQINEPGMGWNYALTLARLAADPSMSAPVLGQHIAEDYVDSYSVPIPPYASKEVAMSVVDAGRIAGLVSDLDDLAMEMMANMEAEHNYYRSSRSGAVSLYSHYVDVYDLVSWLKMYAPDAGVRSAAQAVINASLLTVTYSSLHDLPGGQDLSGAYGLSVYFPTYGGFYDDNYDSTGMAFPAGTLWEEMLADFYAATSTPNDPVGIVAFSPLSDPSVVTDSQVSFSVTVDDEDEDTITYLWYVDGVQWPALKSATENISTTGLSIGNHSIRVTVWDGISTDSHDWTLSVRSKPDLVMTDFSKEDMDGNDVDRATSGRPTLVNFQVTNTGGEASGFNVTCLVDDVPFCYWNVNGLSAGGSVWLQTLPIVLYSVEMHAVTFVLDSDAEVNESNEMNNQGSWVLYVEKAKWTLLIYMDGDNNLEPHMVDDFLQMAQVGSDANVSIVVQFDRIGGYDTRYEDWTGCLRFYVEHGITPVPANAMTDLGEVNMADRSTLASFLSWGTSTFQAERYMVVLKDHGSSWLGCCLDMTSGGDLLDLKETSFALRSMMNATGAPIDLLMFDDCLMGSVEVAAEFKDLALFAVVSETVGWTSNHDSSAILSFLMADPEMSSRSAALGITDMIDLVDDATYVTQSVAAYDLSRAGALLSALDPYLDDLALCWSEDPSNVEMARLCSSSFNVSLGYDVIDLYEFVHNTMLFCGDTALNVTGQGVLDLLDDSNVDPIVLSCRKTPVAGFCHGMSAYFPIDSDHYDPAYTDLGAFPGMSQWDDMVMNYLAYSAPMTMLSLDGTMGDAQWYVSAVEASFTVYDPSSQGLSHLNYSLGGSWHELFGDLTVSKQGIITLYYFSTGSNGAVEVVRNATFQIDTVAPTVTTQVDDMTLTLLASDATSGVSSVRYRIDGGSWQTYSGAFTVGTAWHIYTVEYYATDIAGNVGAIHDIIVGDSDDIAPVSSAEISGTLGTNGWYVSSVIVTLSASDHDGSGLQGMTYSLDGGVWTAYSSPVACSSEGEHTLDYRAKDNFGNEEEVRTLTFKTDLNAPLVGSVINRSTYNGWFSCPVSVNLSASDPVSGVSSISYRVNGGAWTAYSGVLSFSSEGIWLLEWKAADVAGNDGAASNTILRIDMTAPAVNVVLTGFNEEGWGAASARCNMTANDAGSGVAHAYYRFFGGEWMECSEEISFNATGTYVLQFYATDAANNTGPLVNVTCKIDLSAPTTALSLLGMMYEGSYLNRVSVGYEATDEGVGGIVLWYRVGEGNWTELDGSLVISVGTHVLWYRSSDALMNLEAARSVTVTVIDANVPGQVLGLVAVVDGGAVRLSWAAPDDGVLPIISFMIYRSNGSGPELLVRVTGTNYLDEDVEDGVTYSYQVVAVNLLGEGNVSATASVEVPEESSGIDPVIIAVLAIIAVAVVGAAVYFVRRKKSH